MSQLLHDLTIIHNETNKKYPLKPIPADTTAIQLLFKLADKLKPPDGATGTLYHKITEKKFEPNETLSEAGIEDGDVLVAKFEVNENGFAGALRYQRFAENAEPRCPCLLLLDVSSSMAGNNIKELNAGLTALQQVLLRDSLASLRVEIGIITFGSGVKVVQDFVSVNNFHPPTLSADGMTPMGEAINLALDKVEQLKEVYRANRISFYRPWVFMITDGKPTDEWQSAARRVKEFEQNDKVSFYAVAVSDADEKLLSKITVERRRPVRLNEHKWQEMFLWLSSSLKSVSHSKIGDKAPLQSPYEKDNKEDGWAYYDT